MCLLLPPRMSVGRPEQLDAANLFEKKANDELLVAMSHTHALNVSRKEILHVMEIENQLVPGNSVSL